MEVFRRALTLCTCCIKSSGSPSENQELNREIVKKTTEYSELIECKADGGEIQKPLSKLGGNTGEKPQSSTISEMGNTIILNEAGEVKENYTDSEITFQEGTVGGECSLPEEVSVLTEDYDEGFGESTVNIKLLEEYLSFLECPFSWKPGRDDAVYAGGQWASYDNELLGLRLVEHLLEKENSFRFVKRNMFRKVCVLLVIAYEKALSGKLASAASDISQCQELVNKAFVMESEGFSELVVTDNRKEGIYFVLMSSLAHINFLHKLYDTAFEEATRLYKSSSNLNNEAKAIIKGLHAGVLMEYGYQGNTLAITPIRNAIELDSGCWLWWLYLGKLLGRHQRKKCGGLAAEIEEMSALKKAAELQPEAQCLSHLADAYKRLISCIHRHEKLPTGIENVLSLEELESLPKLARELYIRAADGERHCPYINARSAKGLASLPVPFKDLDLAEKYMVRALHLAPDDSLVNHYAALYYEGRREFDQALVSYRRALEASKNSFGGTKNYHAEMGYIKLQHRLELMKQNWAAKKVQSGQIIQEMPYFNSQNLLGARQVGGISFLFQLDSMLSRYKSKYQTMQILCNRGFYLLVYENDIYSALPSFIEAIQMDPKSNILKEFTPIFGGQTKVFNLYEVIEEEITTAVQCSNSHKNTLYLQGLLTMIKEYRSDKGQGL